MRPVRPCGDVGCPCQGGSGLDTLAAVHARAVRAEQRVAVLAAELAALRDAIAPRGPLAATEPGQTPVPRIPGTQEGAQGHSGPRGVTGAEVLATLRESVAALVRSMKEPSR